MICTNIVAPCTLQMMKLQEKQNQICKNTEKKLDSNNLEANTYSYEEEESYTIVECHLNDAKIDE